jgi:hypothetical protein
MRAAFALGLASVSFAALSAFNRASLVACSIILRRWAVSALTPPWSFVPRTTHLCLRLLCLLLSPLLGLELALELLLLLALQRLSPRL